MLGEISDKNGFFESTRKTLFVALYIGFSSRAVIRGNPERIAWNARIYGVLEFYIKNAKFLIYAYTLSSPPLIYIFFLT